jgi:hypothetical protein
MHSYMKQGLEISFSYDPLNMMKYISMIATMKNNTYYSNRSLKVSLVVHPHP